MPGKFDKERRAVIEQVFTTQQNYAIAFGLLADSMGQPTNLGQQMDPSTCSDGGLWDYREPLLSL